MAAQIDIEFFNCFVLHKESEADVSGSFYVEESRIFGGYNNTSVDIGVRAFTASEDNKGKDRGNALIYSGIVNSRTGVNNSNVFSVAEDISRSVDSANGTIQKLYAEDTNLIIFQERKVSRALIDKDAIFSAEGSSLSTTANVVIGQITPYTGEYGISTNPESFAVYGYQKYFADKDKGAVLRLSRDGITEISTYGLKDYFRETLSDGDLYKVVGTFDTHHKMYVISSHFDANANIDRPLFSTVGFSEKSKGWVSFYDYEVGLGFSDKGTYYTIGSTRNTLTNLNVLKHHSKESSFTYGNTTVKPSVNVVLNGDPLTNKIFRSISYYGSRESFDSAWKATSITTDHDSAYGIRETSQSDNKPASLSSRFRYINGKYIAPLKSNNNSRTRGPISSFKTSGVKGTSMELTMSIDTGLTSTADLFSITAEYDPINI